MNAGERRQFKIPLTFLKQGVAYTAQINFDVSPEGKARTKVKHEIRTVIYCVFQCSKPGSSTERTKNSETATEKHPLDPEAPTFRS